MIGERPTASVRRGLEVLSGGLSGQAAEGLSAGVPLQVAAGGEQPWDRDRRLWWMLWSACPGVGWVRLGQLERRFGSLAEAWLARSSHFTELAGIGPAWCTAFEAYRARWGRRPLLRWVEQVRGGRRVLLPGDPAMPPAMASLERPPTALHWTGCGSSWPLLARRRAVAIVGTRRPSRHGLAMADALGVALAQAGWPVVSGLADGIDAAAHRGCLRAGGRPVAVLGTPLERVYPSHHQELQAAVRDQGLLISEQPPGCAVSAGHFAARNRLLVALSRAVVLVECPERSGALHSAGLAWEQQLPLWVVPADAARISARGSNGWLAKGASLLLEPAALIRHLGAGPLPPTGAGRAPCAGAEADAALLEALNRSASLEQLCQSLQSPAAALAPRLLALEMAGVIRAEPGLHWRRL